MGGKTWIWEEEFKGSYAPEIYEFKIFIETKKIESYIKLQFISMSGFTLIEILISFVILNNTFDIL